MPPSLADLIDAYQPDAPLAEASTIPASWYTDARVLELERRSALGCAWQLAGRVEQVAQPGSYLTCELAGGEPVVVVRGTDGVLRAFFNVCRHRAAAVVTDPEGSARVLRCPYHGWTYALDGTLTGTPDFAGVCDFDRTANGLQPMQLAVWEQWVFVKASTAEPSLTAFLGPNLLAQVQALNLGGLRWVERRHYALDCNWKVFVDNYLDGGYHVPHLHKGLDSVLDYREYTIELGERFCLQSSPMTASGSDPDTAAVRTGDRARYFWIYPNLMLNCYEGAMDVNVVVPRDVERTDVIFDFYFADVSESARARNRASIEVSERIQAEDVAICASVQRGLRSEAFTAGRLSVRRESGQHLFHRLLHADLQTGLRRLNL